MRNDVDSSPRRLRIAAMASVGAALLILGQTLTLVHVRPVSEYWYGIVWTGFVLAVDAFLAWRSGASLILDRPRDFVAMIIASASMWWLFELINVLLLDSWSYAPSPDVPRWVQATRSTYFFATLVPATFEASLLAMFVAGTKPAARLQQGLSDRNLVAGALIIGSVTAGFALVFTIVSLPLVLIATGLIIDAINLLRGRTSLLAHLRSGSFSMPLAIGLGNIAAGVIGEMWNYPAHPKWTYRVPYADTVRLFEMPLPGYLGYAALALDLFALYHLVRPAKHGRRALPAEHPLCMAGLS